MELIAILGLIWAVCSIVCLILEIIVCLQSIFYFGAPVSTPIILGFGWKVTGLLLITIYLLPAIKPAIIWLLRLVCGWFGIGQITILEAGVNVAADAAQSLTGSIKSVAGGVSQRVVDGDHSKVYSQISAALGGPDYVEILSHKDGQVTKRVFGTPPAPTAAPPVKSSPATLPATLPAPAAPAPPAPTTGATT